MKKPCIQSLTTVTSIEASAYLDAAGDDELRAAVEVASDRLRLAGSSDSPDDAEIHHALFLLRRARGLEAPSFDLMRVHLRRALAA
jgi:membrane protein required for beta-lactamase induction